MKKTGMVPAEDPRETAKCATGGREMNEQGKKAGRRRRQIDVEEREREGGRGEKKTLAETGEKAN